MLAQNCGNHYKKSCIKLSYVRFSQKIFSNCIKFAMKPKRVPYRKRDIVKSPISFGFHGKMEEVGLNILADSYITKVNAPFFIVVFTVLS